jgi:hypothetical protein
MTLYTLYPRPYTVEGMWSGGEPSGVGRNEKSRVRLDAAPRGAARLPQKMTSFKSKLLPAPFGIK